MSVIGDKVQFGTLYNSNSGDSMAFPKAMTDTHGDNLYTMYDYYVFPDQNVNLGTKKLNRINIGDTVLGKEMTWIYVGEMDGGETYICDRPIFKLVDTNEAQIFLNSNYYAPLEMGIAKSIVEIDGKLYYLRHFNINMYDSFFNIKEPKGNLPVPTSQDRKDDYAPGETEFTKFWNCYYSTELLDLISYSTGVEPMALRQSRYRGRLFNIDLEEDWTTSKNIGDAVYYQVRPALTLIGNVGDVSLSDLMVGSLITIEGFNETDNAYIMRIIGKEQDGSGITTVKIDIPELLGEKEYNAKDSSVVNVDYFTNDYEKSHLLQWLNATGDAGAWFVKNADNDVKPSYSIKAGFLNSISKKYNNLDGIFKSVSKQYYKLVSNSRVIESLERKVHIMDIKERTSRLVDVGTIYNKSVLDCSVYQLFDEKWYKFPSNSVVKSESGFRNLYQSRKFSYNLYAPYTSFPTTTAVWTRDPYYTESGIYTDNDSVLACGIGYKGSDITEVWNVTNKKDYIPIMFLDNRLKVKSGNLGTALISGNSAAIIDPGSKDFGELNSPITIEFNVLDFEDDSYTGTVYIDEEQKGTFSGNASGRHTINLTDYWAELSVAQHIIKINVVDEVGNISEVLYTFTKTNSPTIAPKIIEPANNSRIQNTFSCKFVLGNDVEGDDQTVKVQIANNEQFDNALHEFTTNFEVYNELTEEWEPHLDNAFTSDYVGKFIRINVDATSNERLLYLRVVSTDSGSLVPTNSSIVNLSKGKTLEIQTRPQNYDTQPKKVIVILENMVAEGATAKTYVANNANDELVVWEEYNPTDNGLHVFQNSIKTAEKWGVAVKYEADAGTATGEVSISRIGIGVL